MSTATTRKKLTGFSETVLVTLSPFLMQDPETATPISHAPTATRKEYTTYRVVIEPTKYPAECFEVEVFGRTRETMRVLQYTRGENYIIATFKQKAKESDYDQIILSLGPGK